MRLAYAAAILAVALSFPGNAQTADNQGAPMAVDSGPQQGPAVQGDDDPTIYPNEIAAPAADWDDAIPWGGDPPSSWADDPASVDCKQAPAWCEGNMTAVQAR